MALTIFHNFIFSHLIEKKICGPDVVNSVCEIGEQNWFYRNVKDSLLPILKQQCPDHPRFDEWVRVIEIFERTEGKDVTLFQIAELYYNALFGDHEYMAFDMHGTERSTQVDLNLPLDIDKQYDLVTNLGTSEHIFNQAQVFKTIHDLTKPQGLIYHGLPHQGNHDHGFYNYHPTFFADMAAANGYEIELMAISTREGKGSITVVSRYEHYYQMVAEKKVPTNAGLHVVLRKTIDTVFNIPQQGYYSKNSDAKLQQYWQQHSRG